MANWQQIGSVEKPRHRLIESADGSVCVVSVEEQDGKPVRMAMVSEGINFPYKVDHKNHRSGHVDFDDAKDTAARYVETGE